MITTALEHLYQRVTQSFTADGIQAVNVFGWRMPAQHPYGARIAWVPGDPSGALGATGAARNPGSHPRPIGMLLELFTVYITAQDPSDPENELKQYHLVRLLRDAWYRAVYRAAHGTFQLRAESWVTNKTERRHGATLRIVVEVQAPIVDALPDEPLVLGPNAGLDNAVEVDELEPNAEVVLAETPEDAGTVD